MSDPGAPVATRVAALGAQLRARGVRVGVGELLVGLRALAAAGPRDGRLALRAAMCSRREDLEAFDEAFAVVFADAIAPEDAVAGPDAAQRLAVPRTGVPGTPPPLPPERAPDDPHPVPAAWSEVELLRDRDFAAYTDAERRAARRVLELLARRGPRRRSRRLRPARRRSHTPDLRRTVRSSLRHGGEPLERHWRAPTERPRPLVLVCDVSGSMGPYARVLLQYVQACVAARRRVEAFAFGTRLTRITRELAGRDADRALERAAAAVVDWNGGTRIGEALGELNRAHGRRLGRGAAVVVLSDGWDRGEPALLAAEMARLRRSAHRVVWLNPLAARPGYEPLTRGMQAALPHADRLLAGNTLGSLEELTRILEEDL